MDQEPLSLQCCDAHLTPEQFSDLVGISIRTFYRYQNNPPAWSTLLLALLAGDLGKINPAWSGWTINQKGELCSPFGDSASPGDVMSIYWRREQLRALQVRVRVLEKNQRFSRDNMSSMR